MKNTIVLALLIISFLLLSCENYLNKKRFENSIKIELPKSAKQIQIFDNNYFIIVGKYMIKDRNEILFFINRYGFSPLKDNNKSIIEADKYLSQANQVILNENEFYYISERTETKRWNILINKISGELWIEVLYPGFSGHNTN